jgi:hypothetical protein
MTMSIRKLLVQTLTLATLVAAFALTASSQVPYRARSMGEVPRMYSATCDTSTAPFACTLQQPATGASKVRVVSATVYCSVSCELLQTRGGTAATATAATVRDVNGKGVTAKATVFLRSNVGSGSVAVDSILPPPGLEQGLPYKDSLYLVGNGTTINYTWQLASVIVGRFKVIVFWEEYD